MSDTPRTDQYYGEHAFQDLRAEAREMERALAAAAVEAER